MSIQLGTAVRLQLGEDLNSEFPPSLREIVLPELRELLDRIDPTRDSQLQSGAVDWADLGDRVHFIAEMFRCFQESPFLFDSPFTPAQLERLDAGARPADPLSTTTGLTDLRDFVTYPCVVGEAALAARKAMVWPAPDFDSG